MISIILPAFNCENSIINAIKSIQIQTFTNYELIICDNFSTDSTYDIAKRISLDDDRIVLIRCQEKGISYALNYAIEKARYPYIARMDGDDVSHSDRLRIQYDYLQNNPNIDVIGSEAIGFNDKNRQKSYLAVPKNHNSCLDYVYSGLSPCIHPTIMGKSMVFKDFLYDANYNGAEDYELFARMICDGITFANIKKPLLFYNTTNVSHSKYINILTKAYINLEGIKNLASYEDNVESLVIMQFSYSHRPLTPLQIQIVKRALLNYINSNEDKYLIIIIRLSLVLLQNNSKIFIQIALHILIYILKFPSKSLVLFQFKLRELMSRLMYLKKLY